MIDKLLSLLIYYLIKLKYKNFYVEWGGDDFGTIIVSKYLIKYDINTDSIRIIKK